MQVSEWPTQFFGSGFSQIQEASLAAIIGSGAPPGVSMSQDNGDDGDAGGNEGIGNGWCDGGGGGNQIGMVACCGNNNCDSMTHTILHVSVSNKKKKEGNEK